MDGRIPDRSWVRARTIAGAMQSFIGRGQERQQRPYSAQLRGNELVESPCAAHFSLTAPWRTPTMSLQRMALFIGSWVENMNSLQRLRGREWQRGLGFLLFLSSVLRRNRRAEKITTVEGITEYQLDNGLHLVVSRPIDLQPHRESDRPRRLAARRLRRDGHSLFPGLWSSGNANARQYPKILRHGALERHHERRSHQHFESMETPTKTSSASASKRRLINSSSSAISIGNDGGTHEFERGENSPKRSSTSA